MWFLPHNMTAYKNYKMSLQIKVFTVLAFPCDQFGKQEPGSDAEIVDFCTTKFNVDFPLFSKIEVNGG